MRVRCKTDQQQGSFIVWREGEVKGATRGGYLRVLLDGDRMPELFHPVNEVEYPPERV